MKIGRRTYIAKCVRPAYVKLDISMLICLFPMTVREIHAYVQSLRYHNTVQQRRSSVKINYRVAEVGT